MPPVPAPIDRRVPTQESQALLTGMYENETAFEIVPRDGKARHLRIGSRVRLRTGR